MKPLVNTNIPSVQTFIPELNFCLVHSTERPFTCVECGESFKWKKNLGKFFVPYTGDKQRLFKIKWVCFPPSVLIHIAEDISACGQCLGSAFVSMENEDPDPDSGFTSYPYWSTSFIFLLYPFKISTFTVYPVTYFW